MKSTGLEGGYSVEATDGYLTGPGTQTSAWQDLFNKTRSHFFCSHGGKVFRPARVGSGRSHSNCCAEVDRAG
jgi:hypothetical protein